MKVNLRRANFSTKTLIVMKTMALGCQVEDPTRGQPKIHAQAKLIRFEFRISSASFILRNKSWIHSGIQATGLSPKIQANEGPKAHNC